jgi:hypothetical protein
MSFLSPLFIWTDAMLKSGKSALDSMQAVAKRAQATRVGVIPTADAPPGRASAGKRRARAKAKPGSRARRRS